MLARKTLIESMDKIYEPMLKLVNIPDFTKCIAQFSGLDIQNVSDEVILQYLQTWAKNKYRFFKLLGNKLQYDEPIHYIDTNSSIETKIGALQLEYPIYAMWLDGFKWVETNKVRTRDLTVDVERMIHKIFPTYRIEGSCMTHFFKSCLNAPDEVVTAIGKIFENAEIDAIHCISIDPVDMMLASETPYNWTSCYRLECGNDCLHSDGCLAALLDTSSLITYIWDKEGKFSLYENYIFKSIRYKRMRRWIAVSNEMDAIHFNAIYPGKSNYTEEFNKQLRCIVENWIDKEAIWEHNDDNIRYIYREFEYGYSEYHYENIWKKKGTKGDIIYVFNEEIPCPCGCGGTLPPSQDDGMQYNGDGFVCYNFEEKHYCSIIDDYCDSEDCDCCPYWRRENAVCELDENEYCGYVNEAEDNDCFNDRDSNIVHCGAHCEECPFYKLHYPTTEDAEREEYVLQQEDNNFTIIL